MEPGARKTTLALIASLALTLGAASSAAAACPDEGVRSSSLTQVAIEQSVLCLINQQRATVGIGPVAHETRLRGAAVRHSSEMVREGYFAHTSPSGVGFISRILDTGYMRKARVWLVGENLAWGAGSLSSPAELVRAWMGSPTHRLNLLRDRFREIGISAVRGTPFDPSSAAGITVSTEYGYRSGRLKGKVRNGHPRRHGG